jgi:hypothetical protein
MEPFKPKRTKRVGPESLIQKAVMAKLRTLGWFCISTHGNEFQMGLPDVYAAHRRYGARWIEIKNPEGYTFTPAQIDVFPQIAAVGVGIWVLTSDHDVEINKLFGPPNWWAFLR